MKKNLLSVMLAVLIVFGALMPSSAKCPVKGECVKPAPQEPVQLNKKPLNPDDLERIKATRQAAFAKRLNLSDTQLEEFNKIKAAEDKAMKPIRAKMKKEHAKMKSLALQEKAVREKSIKQLEDILSESQMEELNIIKQETHDAMLKHGPHRQQFMISETQVLNKAVCPPDCGCMCHHPEQAVEPANCKCPCHKMNKK